MRTSFVAAAALIGYANAFWAKGHLLVSRRAQAILEEENPAVLQAVVDSLAVLKESYPSLVREDQYPLTECAPFADTIKGQGYSFQSGWHFINLPYLDQGNTLDDYPEWTQPEDDVVQALYALTNMIMETGEYKDTTYYKQIADHFKNEEDQKSFALRLIVHYVGDVHQPLHSTAEIDDEFPTGDRGGNSEKVPSQGGANNLHAIWDSVVYEYTGKPKTPLTPENFDYYTTETEELANKYAVEMDRVASMDFTQWAKDSYDIAVDDVYADFVEGEIPSQDYIDRALPAIEAHMMLGARRLADTLVHLYGNQEAALFLQ